MMNNKTKWITLNKTDLMLHSEDNGIILSLFCKRYDEDEDYVCEVRNDNGDFRENYTAPTIEIAQCKAVELLKCFYQKEIEYNTLRKSYLE